MKNSILTRFILICGFCIAMTASKAQYVAIPDTNFGNWLDTSGYHSCMAGNAATGWRLDTTCSAVINTVSIRCSVFIDEVSYGGIKDLTGIAYFRHLDTLICTDDSLLSFPVLPASLRYLNLDHDYALISPQSLPPALTYLSLNGDYEVTTLPALPNALVYFNNIGCHLSALPALPASLTHLLFGANTTLVSIPPLPASLTYLYCYNNLISQLPAFPSGVDTFFCMLCNNLTSLPALPASLQYAYMEDNQLNLLPALPASLKYLVCRACPLASMPSLPDSLLYLDCDYCSLTSLPPLNRYLQQLTCYNNNISSIPFINDSLVSLDCHNNALSQLPALAQNLNMLNCDSNYLNNLPALNAALLSLSCVKNRLTSIPALPTNITDLSCSINQLTSLPSLPDNLGTLYCAHNNLSSLPTMPVEIFNLDCRANPNLSCLTYLGPYMNVFYIDSTNIRCLPNRFSVAYYDVWPDTMPLCTATSGCDFFYNIAGNVHNDTSASCMLDSMYPGSLLRNMKVQLMQNNQVIQQVYTFTSGEYSFKTDSLTNYQVTIDTTSLPLNLVCPAGGILNVSLDPADSVQAYQDFGFTCGAADYAVSNISGRVRPATPRPIHITAGNLSQLIYGANCGAGISGTVTTTFSAQAQYVNPAPGALSPASVSGNILTYNIADLNTLQIGSLDIILMADTQAPIGSSICVTTVITPSVPDANAYNDTLSNCFTIHNSYDPNIKSVYPQSGITNGEWLTYTIDFQNTGNDTAYTVVVTDTLSANINASSFQYLASSSKVMIQLTGNAVVFTFPHINLPDSFANPSGSEGWIQYRVKPNANLPIGTQIQNTAFIYFDLNPPIVTNTTVNTIDSFNSLAIKTIESANPIQLYPNPSKGSFTLQTSGIVNTSYAISDVLGHIIRQQPIRSDIQQIDLPEAEEGVYTLSVKGASPIRFVIVR